MKCTINLEVDAEILVEFLSEVTERDLIANVSSSDNEDVFSVEIEFEKENRDSIDEIEEIFERLSESEEEEED
ncbi:MAG: hypothetical protein L6Q66_03650 [Bacteroidia bacterium]|nr:hypothetical protein [Bacteroidia bacterium]